MKLTIRQQRIMRGMADRENLQEGYRDRGLDMTTDPERTKVAHKLPKVTYNSPEVERALAEALTQ